MIAPILLDSLKRRSLILWPVRWNFSYPILCQAFHNQGQIWSGKGHGMGWRDEGNCRGIPWDFPEISQRPSHSFQVCATLVLVFKLELKVSLVAFKKNKTKHPNWRASTALQRPQVQFLSPRSGCAQPSVILARGGTDALFWPWCYNSTSNLWSFPVCLQLFSLQKPRELPCVVRVVGAVCRSLVAVAFQGRSRGVPTLFSPVNVWAMGFLLPSPNRLS